MIDFPNAKINLGLNVVEKRADGFHNIETVFYPIQWKDALEIIPSDQFDLEIKGIDIEGDMESNLITKAYRALEIDHQLEPVKAILLKNIPMGGGLGGGSSDAAFMVKLINQFNALNLTIKQMEDYVRPLGSDCAVFIKNAPTYAFGKGDEFEEINIDLSGYKIVTVNPHIHVGTATAYQYLTPKRPEQNIKSMLQLPVEEWKGKLENDFEESVFKQFPEIEKLKQDLYSKGAIYASMSGSGASVYGIFTPSIAIDFKEAYPKYAVNES